MAVATTKQIMAIEPIKPGNIQSQCYLLSLISNLNASRSYSKVDELHSNINRIKGVLGQKEVKAFTGEWEVVWGPGLANSLVSAHNGIKTTKRYVTDNAMYMARRENKERGIEYFIGISGTNGISHAGWWTEDFNVTESKAWPADFLNVGGEKHGYISLGGYEGLKKLWNMKPENGPTLIEYIKKNLGGQTCKIMVGGHSLGGCLTPILAAALADSLDSNDYSNIDFEAYPTAGPTPGDVAFANHVASKMDYYAIYNTNDLVPLSWDFDDKSLNALKKTYKGVKVGTGDINPSIEIIANILKWTKGLPGETNQYVRNPNPTSPNFNVSTWANPGVNPATTDKDIKNIDGLIKFMAGSLLYKRSPVCAKPALIKLNGGTKNIAGRTRTLLRFLFQAGVQHVPVYLEEAAEKEVGLVIDNRVRDVLTTFFDAGTPDVWTINRLMTEFRELIQQAAAAVATPTIGTELMEPLPEAAVDSEEATEAQEIELLEDLDLNALSPLLLSSSFFSDSE